MRVLIVHNYYGSAAPSGENRVVEAEFDLLLRNNNDVRIYSRCSDDIRRLGIYGAIKGAVVTPWNFYSYHDFKQVVDGFRPDVVHVHNTFPLISPSIFYAAGSNVARVLTLHNYRVVCPAGIPLRNGLACVECIDQRSSFPSIKHGCYRNSRLATLPLAANVSLHRLLGTWKSRVDAFIVLSDFQKKVMAGAGLPPEKLFVKPNFYPGDPSVLRWSERGKYVVFVGRLSEEKGVKTLIRAWKIWGVQAPELRLVGDGPLRAELESMADGLPIRFLGQVDSSMAQSQIASASMLVLPSECFEGFPMVLREAFAFGTPVAVSNMEPLPSIIKDQQSGIVFQASDCDSLLSKVQRAWLEEGVLARLGRAAREEFNTKYNEQENYRRLREIYTRARTSVLG